MSKLPKDVELVEDEAEWEDVPEGYVSDEEMLSWFTPAAWEGLDYKDEIEEA